MKLVQILGPGCAKCEKLKKNAEQAIQELGVEAQVEKITDINKITSLRRHDDAGLGGGRAGEGRRQSALRRGHQTPPEVARGRGRS